MKQKIPTILLFFGVSITVANSYFLLVNIKFFLNKQVNPLIFALAVIYSSIYIIIGIGLLKLNNLARQSLFFITIVQFLNILLKSISKITQPTVIKKIAMLDIVSGMLLIFVVFYYFNRGNIKQIFKNKG